MSSKCPPLYKKIIINFWSREIRAILETDIFGTPQSAKIPWNSMSLIQCDSILEYKLIQIWFKSIHSHLVQIFWFKKLIQKINHISEFHFVEIWWKSIHLNLIQILWLKSMNSNQVLISNCIQIYWFISNQHKQIKTRVKIDSKTFKSFIFQIRIQT